MCPLIVDKTIKRRELIEAAFGVFAHKGFQGASMREISARAGMGKGTIYEYFKSKEDLFYACFDYFNEQVLSQAAEVLKDCASATGKLLKLMRYELEMACRYMDIYSLSFEMWTLAKNGAASELFNAKLKTCYEDYRATLEAILAEGLANGEFRADTDIPAIAALLTGAVDGLLLQLLFERSLDVASHMDSFLDVLIRGLKPD